MTATAIDAATLRRWLHDGQEVAVLDVREGGPYARSHILVASSAPLSQFEVVVPLLVPRRSTRIVLVDDDESSVSGAATLLERSGYTDVSWLTGGNPAWQQAGFLLFSGSGIISKAFGELVETDLGTPHIEPAVLDHWQSSGKKFVLVDARPLAEYRTVSIPGAANCPGAELVLRVPALVPDDETPIVVNCAGRTRSIIGAQSLRDAGLSNPIYALKNGTMGWHLAGLMTAHDRDNMVGEPEGEALLRAQQFAEEVRRRDGIEVIAVADLEVMRRDPTRTMYVFDVRQAASFDAGHFPGSINAPGGQLVQATDSYIAVRNARVVVVDEHRVQSVMTAHWLRRMGWDVRILDIDSTLLSEKGRPVLESLVGVSPEVRDIDVDELKTLVESDACTVVDVGESYWYRQGRIPGSYYAMRSMLADAIARFDRERPLVFCCTFGTISPFAAGDAVALGFQDVRSLMGGRTAWRRAGGSVETIGNETDDHVLTPTDDMWYPPWARSEGVEEAMLQYLTWEVGLLDTVSKETYISFDVS